MYYYIHIVLSLILLVKFSHVINRYKWYSTAGEYHAAVQYHFCKGGIPWLKRNFSQFFVQIFKICSTFYKIIYIFQIFLKHFKFCRFLENFKSLGNFQFFSKLSKSFKFFLNIWNFYNFSEIFKIFQCLNLILVISVLTDRIRYSTRVI